MKRIFLLFSLAALMTTSSRAQLKNILKKDSSGKTGVQKVLQNANPKQGMSNE